MPHPARRPPPTVIPDTQPSKPTPAPSKPLPTPKEVPTLPKPSDSSSGHPLNQYEIFDLKPYIMNKKLGLNPSHPNYPEYEAYHYQPKTKKLPETFSEKLMSYGQSTLEGIQKNARLIYNYFSSYFASDNFDILTELGDSDSLKVRAVEPISSKGGKTSGLYVLSDNSIKHWSGWNFLKELYYQPYGHNAQLNSVKIAEAIPRILTEKADSIFNEYDQARETLTRKAAVALGDKFYQNEAYLKKLIGEFEELSSSYRNKLVVLDQSKICERDPLIKNVQKALDKLLEDTFKNKTVFYTREELHVDDLKFHVGNFFRRMDKISEKAKNCYYEIHGRKNLPTGKDTVDFLRARLHQLVHLHHQLRQECLGEIKQSMNLVQYFEQIRSTLHS